jgi:hypothetical protein
MRTTLELNSRHRAELLKLAAERGDKGFSKLVGEALDLYFKARAEKWKRAQQALKLQGSFSASEGESLTRSIAKLRETWR